MIGDYQGLQPIPQVIVHVDLIPLGLVLALCYNPFVHCLAMHAAQSQSIAS